MTNCGWISLYRKSLENPLFRKPLIWHYWQYCLLKANHTDQKIIWNKKEMIIKKGSFITGRKKAAEETGLSQRNVRTAIDTLINLGMILKSPKSTSKFSYLTVCNYNKYQQKKEASDQQATSKRPASDQQVTTNNNDNNEKQLITKHIYNFWNDQKIIIHKKLTSKTNTAIKSALKDYSKPEILKAIENYKTVLTSENHYWTHKWTLLDFLNRGLSKFIDAADPINNFLEKKQQTTGDPIMDGNIKAALEFLAED